MSALVGKKTLAPGESVGLFALTGATPGKLYSLTALADGLGIVSSADDTDSYALESRKTYLTDSEVLVKNLSSERKSIRAVAMLQSNGDGAGDIRVGRKVLAPGESAGLLSIAGMPTGTLVEVSAQGRNVAIVSSIDSSATFELESRRSYLTNEEIIVKNVSSLANATVSVLVVPAVEGSSGGGGGGAVSSVNGKTGAVALELKDLIPANDVGYAFGAVGLTDTENPDDATLFTYIGPQQVAVTNNSEASASLLKSNSLAFTVGNGGSVAGNVTVVPSASTSGNLNLSLPDKSGALAVDTGINFVATFVSALDPQ